MKQMLLIKTPLVIMDDREDERIEKILREKGIVVVKKRLEVGDYIIGDTGIERKSASDFLNSIVDGRIFEQIKELSKNFENFILIVEGDFWKCLKFREIHENVVRGTILSLIIDFNSKIIFSRDIEDTANYISLLAKREKKNYFSVGKKSKEKDVKIAILCQFPGIGPKLAKKLIERFGTLEKIFNATFPELKKVIGEERARKFLEVLKG